jgi:hypothetical protein
VRILTPLLLLVGACAEDKRGHAQESGPDAGYDVIALEASEAFVARQSEYLDYCHANNGPDLGGLYGQICRVARGDAVNIAAIEAGCEKLATRVDTADFSAAALVRLLYLDNQTGALDPATRSLIEQTLLDFKYWIDEPGTDQMCYWSENHQILYHSSELLVGQLFPERVFPNAGMTGNEHAEHAQPRAERWLDLRGKLGFSEWHSNVYFNEDIPALLNLVDFAEEPHIRTKASAVLDLMAFDLLNNTYKGNFATVHGRTYEGNFIDGLSDSTTEASWIMTGLGDYASTDNFSATFMATSDYFTPQILELIANDTTSSHEHRQRDSIDTADGPDWGIGYESHDDILVWAGMSALLAPEVITGTLDMLDELDLWDGFLFADLPDELTLVLKAAQGAGTLPDLARTLDPVASGIALQGMSTYVYRTPHYQLAGGQDYHPGTWASQTQMWLATLDEEAYVFTSFPSDIDGADLGVSAGGSWIGSWLPRATFHKNVGVIQYRSVEVPLVDAYIASDHTHAYFPRDRFDEVREQDGWTIGRKGDAYVALYSENPTFWAVDNHHELDAEGKDNTWIVEMGSQADNGSFDAFVEGIVASSISTGATVVYDSPTQGRVEVGWEGPITVQGEAVDLGPYPRWSNAYSTTEFGASAVRIDREHLRLVLDFDSADRRLMKR